MVRDVKGGSTFYTQIDSDFDILGIAGEFDYVILNLADNSEVANGVTDAAVEEVLHPHSDHTATTDGAATAGSSVITVDSGNAIVAGEVIDDGAGNLYYVTEATDTSLTLKHELKADIADNTSIATVGNSGVYKLPVKIADAGEYDVILTHPKYGRIPATYRVLTNTIDDVASTQNSKFAEIENKLDSMGASAKIVVIS